MNSVFSSSRFGRLFMAHLSEHRRDYFWFLVVAGVFDLIFLMLAFGTGSNHLYVQFQYAGQAGWYMVGLFITGIIFAARYYRQLSNPGAELILLMRPASHVEKCLLAMCVVSVLYPLAYTVCFAVLNYPVVQLAHALYVAPAVCKDCPDAVLPNFSFYIPFVSNGELDHGNLARENAGRYQLFMLLLLWSAQALFVGGAMYFRRSPVLKTSLSLFLLFVVLSWSGSDPRMGAFWAPASNGAIAQDGLEVAISVLEWLGLPVLLWTMVFFNIKEREVA